MGVPDFECPYGVYWDGKRIRRRLRGLGDVLAALFKAVGVKQKPGCGCKRRQEKLNKLTVRSLFAWLRRKLRRK